MQKKVNKKNIKNIIFDFDNTLENWDVAEKVANKEVSGLICEKYNTQNITPQKFIKQYNKSKLKFISNSLDPKSYKREVWIMDALDNLNIDYTKKFIKDIVKKYWEIIDANVVLLKDAIPLLKYLKKEKYRIFIYSDSDGAKKIKTRRIKLFKIERYFDKIFTSDDTKLNKPNTDGLNLVLKWAKIKPDETIFIGDNPKADLSGSKKVGMDTIWIKRGFWSRNKEKFNFIDYEVKRLNQVPKILSIYKN